MCGVHVDCPVSQKQIDKRCISFILCEHDGLTDMFSQSILIHLWDSSGHCSFKKLESIESPWLDTTPYGREARQYVRLVDDFVPTFTV